VELLTGVVGPLATNVYLLADPATSEAVAIDTATPSVDWLVANLERRGWRLKLVVSTHGHWDHIGDNARVAEHTGASIAAHPLDRKIVELRSMRGTLADLVERCRGDHRPDCPILDDLADGEEVWNAK